METPSTQVRAARGCLQFAKRQMPQTVGVLPVAAGGHHGFS